MELLQVIFLCVVFFIIGALVVFLFFKNKTSSNKEVERQAFTDPLTGGKNRHMFMFDLDRLIAKGNKFAICFMDLDGFKQINDTMGHDAGDELLINLSKTFIEKLPKNVVSYRIGGDEFGLIITDIKTTEDITKILDNLRLELNNPFIIENNSISLEYSLGIAMFPEDAKTKKELVNYADDAMYYIKEHGKNDYYFHNKVLKAKLENTTKMEKELKNAFEKKEFGINFQPRINLKNKNDICFEALLYWKHPVLGEISSEYFIKQAEEMSLIIKLDEYVLRLACENLVQLQKYYPEKNISIAVNLSNSHMKRKNFVKNICDILQEYEIEPGKIKLEFTDDIDINKISEYKYLFDSIKNSGANIIINNLQIKYNCISILKTLPIDEIKLSSKYVNSTAQLNSNILCDVIKLCKDLEYKVTIIAIDDNNEVEYLGDMDVDYVQGELIAKKMKFEQLEDLLKQK